MRTSHFFSYGHALPALVAALVTSLLAGFGPADGYAQPTEAARHFDIGNTHYVEGRYQQALVAYQQAEDAGYTSGALYYNMGNAYFRLDEIGQAIRFYEKARRLMPDDRDLLHNLEIAQTRTLDQFSQFPRPFWIVWWHRLLANVGVWWFFGAGLAFYLGAVGLIGYRIWSGTRSPWHRRALTVSLLVGFMLLAAAFAAALDREINPAAVLLVEEAPLRAAPLPDAASDLDIHEGVVVDILNARGGWIEVRLPNGATGWIEADAVGEI